MSQQGASYRAAGVDYDALDAGKRLAMAKALVDLARCSAARGGRALDASRGEPAFVFELGEQTLRVRGGGPRHEVDHRAPRARGPGGQPLRRRRLRHGRGDPQRPLLRGRAAARRQRLLRHRRLGVVPAARERSARCWRAGARRARTRAARGAGASRRRCRGCSPSRRSSWRVRPSAWCPRGARRSSASALAPGDEIVLVASSGLHANGASLARAGRRAPAARATRRRCPTGATLRRGAARPVGDVRAAGRGAAASERRRADLHQPRHRPRPAEADAPAARR